MKSLPVVPFLAVLALLGALSALLFLRPSAADAGADADAGRPFVEFAADGRLLQPTGYRKWVQVGTPLTPNDMNDGKAAFPEFHSVYMDPASFERYEQTGDVPDGTVLVKELVSVGGKAASSGNGYFMGEFTGLEVSIKDSERFADEPGSWAYFSFGHEYPLAERVAKNPAATCNQCHALNAQQDWVFTQYYPVLRAAAAE